MGKALKLGVLLSLGESLALYERMGQKERLERSYLARYAEAFDEVRLFTYGSEEPELDAPANVRVFPKSVPGPELVYSALMPAAMWRRFKDLSVIRSLQSLGGLPAIGAKKLFGVPFVTTQGFFAEEHCRVERGEFWAGVCGRIERAVLRRADAIIVTTGELRDYAAKFAAGERVHTIPNGVELEMFGIENRKLPFSGDAVTILFVGRLSPQKDLPTLVKAASKLPFDYRVVIVGEGEERAAVERLAGELGVAVEFAGVVPHGELPSYYLSADVFVLPSRIEGHPKALLEAFAAALPCVGARVGGIAGLIEDGKNGLLFEFGDADDLAGKIRMLAESPELARRLGAEARRLVEERFDLGKLVAKEIELLLRIAR